MEAVDYNKPEWTQRVITDEYEHLEVMNRKKEWRDIKKWKAATSGNIQPFKSPQRPNETQDQADTRRLKTMQQEDGDRIKKATKWVRDFEREHFPEATTLPGYHHRAENRFEQTPPPDGHMTASDNNGMDATGAGAHWKQETHS